MRQLVAIFLILSLSLSQGFSILTASIAVNDAQEYASDDVVLICSGASYQWVSLSAFYERGELVVVDPPADFPPVDDHSLDCGYEFLSLHDGHNVEFPQVLTQHIVYKGLVERLGQRPYTSYPYLTSHSRAPPFIV